MQIRFSIETATKLVEAKAIAWPMFDPAQARSLEEQDYTILLKQVLLIQKQIAQEVAQKDFQLHSKHKIPQEWKNWLSTEQIPFFDGDCKDTPCSACAE